MRTLRYLAIGDSLTVGYGAEAGYGFVELFARLLEQHADRSVLVENAGVIGHTSKEIRQKLEQNKSLQESIAKADIITVTAGGNDILQAAYPYFLNGDTNPLKKTLKSCKRNIEAIMRFIAAIKGDQAAPYLILLITLYNPIPMIEESKYWVSKLNEHIESIKSPRLQFVTIYQDYLGREEELISEDHVHPNALGYQIMARRVFQVSLDFGLFYE